MGAKKKDVQNKKKRPRVLNGQDNEVKKTENKPVKKGHNLVSSERPSKGQKKSRQSSSSSSSSLYVLLFGTTLLVAVVAIIYANEDLQTTILSFTKQYHSTSEPLVNATYSQTGEEVKDNVATSRSRSNEEVNKESSENSQTEKSYENEKQNVVKEIHEARKLHEQDVSKQSSVTEESVAKDSKEPSFKEKNDETNETTERKKSQERRKDYSKHSITNKADYKLRKMLDEADIILSEGDIEQAMKLYDKILAKNPNSPRAAFGKAKVTDKLAEQRRSNTILEEAIELMDRALRLDNVPSALLLEIGKSLADRQKFRGWSGKSVGTWKYMIEKLPDIVELRQQLGVSYLLMGQNEKARGVFKDVLKIQPEDGFSLVHLGFIVQATDNNPVEAIPLLQRGINTGAEGTVDGRFYFQLGDAYVRTGQREKADDVYKLGAEKGLFMSQYQRSLYNVDKLTARPWWTPEQTTYSKHLKLLEKNWETIRDEGLAQLNAKTGSFQPEEENLRETGDWKQFMLYSRGQFHGDNCQKAPKTCALIDKIPDAKGCKRGQVKYSVMQPGVHVWPHCGPTNCRIRAHLGLVVPQGPRIRVANDTREWKEGKFIIFDDSFEHEVWHDGTELRMVLIVDFWHPELTPSQKRELSPI